MKTKRLLDSYAVLAYLNGEPAAEAVEQAMKDAGDSGSSLLMSEINIGEVYYILSRKRGPEKADYFVDTILQGLPIQGLPIDFSLILQASRLKAKYPLSYSDCLAAAQAIRSEASILTGDLEFKAVETLVAIEWL
ncbi:MAG: type II toxin-antitoxin system VapC family toxin [Desulfobacterales bacterium]